MAGRPVEAKTRAIKDKLRASPDATAGEVIEYLRRLRLIQPWEPMNGVKRPSMASKISQVRSRMLADGELFYRTVLVAAA